MASELERLEAQIAWAFAGPAWHGPSVLESIAGLTPGAAHAHPVTGAHSAWQLLLHLAGTYHTQFVGITQHDLYHAGQIAILRKALGGGPTAP